MTRVASPMAHPWTFNPSVFRQHLYLRSLARARFQFGGVELPKLASAPPNSRGGCLSVPAKLELLLVGWLVVHVHMHGHNLEDRTVPEVDRSSQKGQRVLQPRSEYSHMCFGR